MMSLDLIWCKVISVALDDSRLKSRNYMYLQDCSFAGTDRAVSVEEVPGRS